jgi:hypothetical protein
MVLWVLMPSRWWCCHSCPEVLGLACAFEYILFTIHNQGFGLETSTARVSRTMLLCAAIAAVREDMNVASIAER